MKITINDIAKAAKVSKSTVSKVINNSAEISEKTKEKVKKIMQELDYYPDVRAQQVASQKKNNITLLIDANEEQYITDQYFYNIICGIEKVLFAQNFDLTISNINNFENIEMLLEKFVYSKKTDGILLPGSALNKHIIDELKRLNFPFVIIGQPLKFKNNFWVDIDNKLGSKLAVSHLLKQGYKRIAYVGGLSSGVISKDRQDGYREAICDNFKNDYSKEFLLEVAETNNIADAIKSLYNRKEKPDAITCEDNFFAHSVLKTLKNLGLNTPKDVGIVCFNNYPLAEYMEPPLTAIDIDTFKLGQVAADLIFQIIQNVKDECCKVLIKPGFIVRDSSLKR